jgi:DNA-binding PadR family transcriptional regulator
MTTRTRRNSSGTAAAASTPTEVAVLGLLTEGERSGYDLLRLAERSVGFFWTPAKSHVYGTLARLVDAGLATVRAVPQETRPDKQLYRISPAGRRAFLDWLANAPLEPARFKNPFLLKIFFGRHLERERLIAHIEEGRAEVQEELSQLQAIEKTLDPDRDFHGWLTLTYGLERDRATVRWADAALAALRRRR